MPFAAFGLPEILILLVVALIAAFVYFVILGRRR
jgi:hypothetical protein